MTAYFAWLQNSQASAWVRAESPWLWPLCETLHFVGLALLLGIAGLMDFRLMGFLREVPMRAISSFRNWAVAAFGLNLATGLVFFTGSTNQYVVNPYWWAKVAFLLLAGSNAIAFETIIRHQTEAAQLNGNTPLAYKVVGALSLISWLGVLICGRLLPFVGGTD